MALTADVTTTLSAQEAAPAAALEGWIACHADELRRHLVRLIGTEDDAEDLLQQVWITAHRSPPALDGSSANVRAWLFRVATNAALDRLAQERRRRALLAGREARIIPEQPDTPDAAFAALDERTRRRVREHVARLPRRQRQAVWLRWVEGADYDTIALELGSSAESARANVYNGLKRLRAELFDLWQEEGGP